MTYGPLKTRLISEVGTRAWLRVYWDEYLKDYKSKNTCPNSYGNGKPGCHDARIFLMRSPELEKWDLGGRITDYQESAWPTKCDFCGAATPPPGRLPEEGSGIECVRQVFKKRLYNSATGDPEPGDLFLADWYHKPGEKCVLWDNCTKPHLIAILPNGRQWDIDGRASNCTSPNDRLHRCWIRRGEAPDITVGKDGPTCSAGAGSIASDDYHGFLIAGSFTQG